MILQELYGNAGLLLPNAIYVPKGEEIAISQDWLIFPEAITGEGKVWTIDGLLEPCIKPDNEVWVDSNVENPFAEPIIYKGKNKYGWLVGEITEDVINELDYIDCNSVRNIVLSNYITLIPDQAFFECYDLQYMIISNSVLRIGKQALKDCENIKIHYNGNSSDFKNIEFGLNWNDNVPAEYAYCNDTEVRIKYNCITFTAIYQDCSIGFYNNPNSSIYSTIEFSFDQVNWNILTDNVAIENSYKMYCRGINPDGISGGYEESGYNYFIGEGKFNVSGDIMSLIDYNMMPDTMVGTLYTLFGRDSDNFVDIVDASDLILSAKILTSDCYQKMFNSCSSMIYSPQIKAEVLAPYCYHTMFFGCSSLSTALELPATKLASNCYYGMFYGCTSLTVAPELPATTLVNNCYSYMFEDCTSLVTAPELPATTLAYGCYDGMFRGCTKLNYIKCLATDISATNCTYFWVIGVASEGTFIKHPDMNDWTAGVNGIPTGWTVKNN